jgi:hypothetical protein
MGQETSTPSPIAQGANSDEKACLPLPSRQRRIEEELHIINRAYSALEYFKKLDDKVELPEKHRLIEGFLKMARERMQRVLDLHQRVGDVDKVEEKSISASSSSVIQSDILTESLVV